MLAFALAVGMWVVMHMSGHECSLCGTWVADEERIYEELVGAESTRLEGGKVSPELEDRMRDTASYLVEVADFRMVIHQDGTYQVSKPTILFSRDEFRGKVESHRFQSRVPASRTFYSCGRNH